MSDANPGYQPYSGAGAVDIRTMDNGSGDQVQVVAVNIGGDSAEIILTGGAKTTANSLPVAIASDQTPVPTNQYYGATVALVTPPTALTVSTDTTFTFASKVNHVLIQNKSNVDVNINWDSAASAGTAIIPGGANNLVVFHIPVTTVHLYSAAATNVNGSSGLNIVLQGWL